MQFLMSFILFSLTAASHADTLTILNWEEYLSEEVISAWEKQSGHEIHQIYFDNDEHRDSILLNHKDKIIDLVIIDEIYAQEFGKIGRLTPTASYPTHSNIENVDRDFQKSCGDYGVPYLWGTLGIVYRTDKILTEPRSWNFILKPTDKLKQHIGFIDDFMDMLAPSLFILGKLINTENTDDLKQAFNIMKELVPSILTFEYSISFVDADKKSDQLYVALAYSGDQDTLNSKAGKDIWKFTTLEEGTITWVDCFSVINDSPRKNIAYDFLNFIYKPEIAAKNSESVYVASPLAAARLLQSEDFLSDKSVYPNLKKIKNVQQYKPVNPKNIILRNRITSSLIKSHDSQ
jgi:spermidine/putrescine transport system substrate-binding protein